MTRDARRVATYAAALAVSGAALGFTIGLRVLTGVGGLFSPLLAAVALAVWFGGLGPALLATAFGAFASTYFLLQPIHSFDVLHRNDLVRWAVFVAVALLITALGDRMRRARRRAEAAEERQALLASVDVTLQTPFVLRERLELLARLVVARGAVACVVELDDGEKPPLRTLVHVQPEAERKLTGLADEALTSPALARVVGSGRAEVVRVGDASDLLAVAGADRWAIAPLVARGRTLGTLALGLAMDGRSDADGRSLAEEVARRAALAIDNARLYEAEQESRAVAEHARERAVFLAHASELLVREPGVEGRLARLVELLVPARADLCTVELATDGVSPGPFGAACGHLALEPAVASIRSRTGPFHRALEPVVQAALASRRPAEAEDLADERVASVLVVPLVARRQVVGLMTLGAGRSRGRFGADEVELLADLADRAALAIDNAMLYEEQGRIASVLQRSLLPPDLPAVPGADLAVAYRPAGEGHEIGGDFYDVFPTGDGSWSVVIGDVCGKGPEAAVVTALARHTLRAATPHAPGHPREALVALNAAMLDQLGDGRFLTAVQARVTAAAAGADLLLCRAAHPLPLVVRADGRVDEVRCAGGLLGVFRDPGLGEVALHLDPGESLVLVTDGVTEAHGPHGMFGAERLATALVGSGGGSARALIDRIEAALAGFEEGSPRDDRAILVLAAST